MGFDYHTYASLKTTGQLVMDLGSVSTHIVALVSLMSIGQDNFSVNLLKWFLVGTIIFQAIVAVGLYIFRTVNHEDNEPAAHVWNIIFFICLFFIAILEIFIAAYEKFGLEHGSLHGGGNCSRSVL